jgi:Nudix N-terminal
MSDSVFCNNCGAPIIGESPSGDPAQRKPCPQCGSLARSFNAQLSGSIYPKGSVTAVVITYPEALLTTAQGLIVQGDFSIVVVVAHMACEISAERSLSRAFAAKGIGYLEESVEDLLPGYNMANDRVRNLYNALIGDEIQKQSFWQAFKQSATRRNQTVHKGKIVTKSEAEASFKAASDLVAYLK